METRDDCSQLGALQVCKNPTVDENRTQVVEVLFDVCLGNSAPTVAVQAFLYVQGRTEGEVENLPVLFGDFQI